MTSVRLTTPALGSLFVISESDWTAISKRVGLVVLAAQIAPIIGRTLLDFPALETACQAWKNTTFPALVTQSGAIRDYAGKATQSFTSVQQAIANLKPDDPLPAAIRTTAQNAITALATGTTALSQSTDNLATQIKAFMTENQVVDAQVAAYVQALGPQWQSLAPRTAVLENALGLVRGRWKAIADDLDLIASGKIDLTMALLLSLDIQSALLAWGNLRAEAAAFASMARDQQQYLSGAYLSG
jgi:hypothetical protein